MQSKPVVTLRVSVEGTLAWEHEDQQLEVKVVWGPGRGLMLRDRGDDGNVVLGIGGVQQGVETTSPWRDLTWSNKKKKTLSVQRKVTSSQFLAKRKGGKRTKQWFKKCFSTRQPSYQSAWGQHPQTTGWSPPGRWRSWTAPQTAGRWVCCVGSPQRHESGTSQTRQRLPCAPRTAPAGVWGKRDREVNYVSQNRKSSLP